jgi:transglutaminase-like putative cysteine protease
MEVLRINLPLGKAATEETLRIMSEIVRYAATTERLRYAAIDMIRGLYCSSPRDYVQAVAIFCRQRVMLIHEPDEILIDPVKMLDDMEAGNAAGDCDDISMIAAALLTAIGIECRFKAVFPAEAGHYQHVFVEYRFASNQAWMPLDLTISGTPVYPPDWIVQGI